MEVCMIRMTPAVSDESGQVPRSRVAEVVRLSEAVAADTVAAYSAPVHQDPANGTSADKASVGEGASTARASELPWHSATRVLFRFAFLYFSLIALFAYSIPLYFMYGSDAITEPIDAAWDVMVPWVGEHVLHLSYEITVRPNGSGDTTYNYVQVAILAVAALVGALVWTLIDRRRTDYRVLTRWLMVACRYYLAVVMVGYGMIKVFKTQFPFPSLEQLMLPYGDSSPMRLAWTFMGYSKLYTAFAGAGEVIGGLLLLFRRTTALGALVTFAVMSNVVMLNFGYDIPVKLFSSHLLLFAGALVVPDGRRLANVLLLNRPAGVVALASHFVTRRANTIGLVVKLLFIALILFQTVSRGLTNQKKWGDKRPKPPLYGIYEVSTFVEDGETLPPLVTDDRRWRHLIIDRPGYVSVQRMDGEIVRYAFEIDPTAKTAEIWAYDRFARADFRLDPEPKAEPTRFAWTWSQPSPEILTMAGELEGRHLSLEMQARDASDFLLIQRGFRWINEVPFN